MKLLKIKTFTLIELLIVITIVGILSVAIIPRVSGGQISTRNTVRKAHITQIYTAFKSYETTSSQIPSTLSQLVPDHINSLPKDPKGFSACNNSSTNDGLYGYVTNGTQGLALLAQVEGAGKGLPRNELYLLSGSTPCNLSINTIQNSVCTSKPGRTQDNPLRTAVIQGASQLLTALGNNVHAQESPPTCNGLTATIWVNSSNIIVGGPNNGQVYNGSNLVGGSRNTDGHVVVGTLGEDIINGAYLNGNDTICGLGGNDTIYGQQGNDRIDGGYGNDTIYGGEGIDTINGGQGNDMIEGGNGNDILYGGAGDDTINGTYGNNKIYGGDGNDILNGAEGGDDEIYGGDGNDVIDGKSGINTLDGGAGDDTINGGNDKDIIYGGIGHDTINAGHGINEVHGGPGNDTIITGNDDDYITGGDGDDTINAGHGYNVVYGGNGDDTIEGGGGNDRINGGAGRDHFIAGWGQNACIDFNPDEDTSTDPSIHTPGCNNGSISNRGRAGNDPNTYDNEGEGEEENGPSQGIDCAQYTQLPVNHKLYYILIQNN